MTTPTQPDVLIVGAGPVGTALAIDLTRRGLTVRIIDKADASFGGSRAKGIQPRTLEVLNDLGALDDVLAAGAVYPLMGLHLGPVTLPWRMLRSPYAGDDSVPYPHTWLVPQYRTDQALRDRLHELGVDVEYRCELRELSQTSDTVSATIGTPHGAETITAGYLVGADGAASVVRKQVGIGFLGSTHEEDRILIVDAVVDGGLSRNRWHVWPGLRGQFTGACPLPHTETFQWMIRLSSDEAPPSGEEEITRCIRARTGNKRLRIHNITWKSVFRPNIRLAEHYRQHRVFLAGDAAHAHTPAGAQGLNTGIQDSYNLGWKLGQVLAGAPEVLLDTYQAERQPIAAGVLELSTKKYGKADPSAMKRGKDEQQIALSYRGGPLASATTQCTAILHVGDRAPNAPLRQNNKAIQLFDLCNGPQFTALAYGPTAAHQLDQLNWPDHGSALQRIKINGGHPADHGLRDNTGSFARNYGLDSDALLLIRPDGYIASIATHDMLATTTAAIATLTPPNHPHQDTGTTATAN